MPDITKEELSELKDQIELFKQNTVWQHILAFMQRMYADAAEEALNADEDRPGSLMAKVKYAGGMAYAVKMIAAFDENIPLFKKAKEAK